MAYPLEFKQKMIEKMVRPGGPSALELAEQTGVAHTTLCLWRRQAGKVKGMADSKDRRPQDWSAQEKLQAVVEAEGLSDEQLGAFLRRKGLHKTHLERWRTAMQSALDDKPKKRSGSIREARKIRDLERELQRKDKALAEASALLVLKKKAQAIWGDEDDDTENGS